uniref:Related to glycosyl hydrolase n=1 Tax=Ramularia collo-cygni TaxID=112498 RepID=A0A2D3VJB4_9PEZI
MPSHRLRISGDTFLDSSNRQVILHGINVSGDSKLPSTPNVPSHEATHFFSGDEVQFTARPFALSEAHTHFARLRSWGFNTLRYIFTWEALEHAGPQKYDEEYIQHTISTLRVAKEYGFYVFMDPHQDVWSRFTGGSGAPMWSIYACGLDPKNFTANEASLVQNTWSNPAEYPKMVWATNYYRLAVQTIFTLFFAGRDFAPKCVIDGVNIQDYLQKHFVDACAHLARRIHEAGDLEGECVIGWESVNEPNKGYFAHPDLSKIPKEQNLRKTTTPTAWQSMLTGMGRAVEVETWDFGSFGPYKSGMQLIDPKGVSAWLDPTTWDDSTYGWKRDPAWKLGQCIWAQHGVWDPSNDTLLQPQYFLTHPQTKRPLSHKIWTDENFIHYFKRYSQSIRSIWPQSFLLLQPQPFEIPPFIKGTPEGDDPNLIFASHFYDGITLITKKWNKIWNIDVLGVLRGRYSSPAFAIKLGESSIRNCFKDQLTRLVGEGTENMGVHPSLYTEIGIPYDMDDSQAYSTGNYSSQTSAVDANFYAVEGSGAQGCTWWVYTADNSHEWGDQWNGEDLSIFSKDDLEVKMEEDGDGGVVTPGSLGKTLSVDGMSTSSSSGDKGGRKMGYRAAEAYIRPVPRAVHGRIVKYGFDLKKCVFELEVDAKEATTDVDFPTEIFLPSVHFPAPTSGGAGDDNHGAGVEGKVEVEISGGKFEIRNEGDGRRILRWWHGVGEQRIRVKGVVRKLGGNNGEGVNGEDGKDGEDEGYLEAYWRLGKGCGVM